MRVACIDIGSNTTRLLVAEARGEGLEEIVSERAFTRLREGLTDARVAEVAAAVAEHARIARAAGASEVRAVGTAAVRGAGPAGPALAAAVRAAAELDLEVLSGEEEARLAFLGATHRQAPVGPVAVVDVGGGSTELVCGTPGEPPTWAVSLALGSGALADRHLRGDPPGLAELAAVRDDARDALAAVSPPAVEAAYAVGGSATSLRRLLGEVLDRPALEHGIRAVCEAPAEEMARRLDLHVERVRVLPAGMLVLHAATAALGHPLQVCGGGLREGVALELLATSARP